MDYCDRLKQEVAACSCTAEAKRVLVDYRKELARLDATAREQLYAELIDVMKELPAAGENANRRGE